jgi:hypothetical protein
MKRLLQLLFKREPSPVRIDDVQLSAENLIIQSFVKNPDQWFLDWRPGPSGSQHTKMVATNREKGTSIGVGHFVPDEDGYVKVDRDRETVVTCGPMRFHPHTAVEVRQIVADLYNRRASEKRQVEIRRAIDAVQRSFG